MPPDALRKQYNTLATLLKPHKIRLEKDYRRWRCRQAWYIQKNIKEIDLSTVSGRIKYYRILRGISARQMGIQLGYEMPDSYTRCFEDKKRDSGNLEKVTEICKILQVPKEVIFDDYLKFLDSDYQTRLILLQEQLGKSNVEMDKLFGMTKGQYRKWITGKKVPSRQSVKNILAVLENIS